MNLNIFSKTITQDDSLPAAQAMLYAIGLKDEDLSKGWLYLYDGKYYIASVNLLGKTRFCFGETIDKLDTNIHYINFHNNQI